MKPVRRNKEDFKKKFIEDLRGEYKFPPQPHFKGSEEELQFMEDCERAYRVGEPIISDQEWDELVKKYNYVESWPKATTASGRKLIPFITPMTSLRKVWNKEDLIKFVNANVGKRCFIEPKLDGVAGCVFYKAQEDGRFKLWKISTAGDGINGFEINEHALAFVENNIQTELRELQITVLKNHGCLSKDGCTAELRGEFVVRKIEDKKSPDRSVVSGMINRQFPTTAEFVIWYTNKLETVEERKSYLKKLGYMFGRKRIEKLEFKNDILFVRFEGELSDVPMAPPEKITSKKEEIEFVMYGVGHPDGQKYFDTLRIFNCFIMNKCNTMETKITEENVMGFFNKFFNEDGKNNENYECDGFVIKLLNQYNECVADCGKDNPKNQIAVKIQTEKYPTRILKIETTETELGNINCSALIEPVITKQGTTVKNVNLHNPDWLKRNSWIKVGVDCNLIMSSDIIPILEQI